MRFRTLHTVCRFEPYARPHLARITDVAASAARAPLSPPLRAPPPLVRKQLLETAVAAWPEVLTVPPPGSDTPDPPTWAAWSCLFGTLLRGVTQTANIVGLDVWLSDVQRAQLARTYPPPTDKGPLSVLACRMGAESGSPRTFNVVRRLLELREALWLAAQLPGDWTIDVGCDQKKWKLGPALMAPSSDLAICGPDGQVLRRIEVTSLHKAAQGPEALRRGLVHILRKAEAEQDGASHEGCIAVHWAPGVVARDCLESIVTRLNAPMGYAPIWQQISTTLQSVTFVDYSPTLAPRVWGRLRQHQGGWVIEDELRLERRQVARRMSTGQLVGQGAYL